MEQLLSQDEIDALLKGISDGEVETAKEGEPEAVAAAPERVCAEVFDFAKYTKGRKERLSALEFISDRLSKSLRSALTLFLEREVEINIAPTQYTEYGEFIKTLPLPTNMNIVITDNLKGFFIVIFDAKLIFCVLETVFGSNTITVPKIEGREFTKIEFNVIKKLVDLVSVEMEKAWEPVYEIQVQVLQIGDQSELHHHGLPGRDGGPSRVFHRDRGRGQLDEDMHALRHSRDDQGLPHLHSLQGRHGDEGEVVSKTARQRERGAPGAEGRPREEEATVQEFLKIKRDSVIITDTLR